MDEKVLLAVYGAIIVFVLILSAAGGKKNKAYYENLNKKEHPFRFMYPAAAVVYGILRKLFRVRPGRKMVFKIRRLHVKENVAEETFLFLIQKIAVVLTILLVTCAFGLLLCAVNLQDGSVDYLDRNEHGKGDAVYDLDVMYDGSGQRMQLEIAEQQYTEKEILKKFDTCASQVRKEMLGENLSAENVTKPLNLIPEYEGIQISWEIEDPQVLDYNGTLSESLRPDEKVLLNLFATFSMDEVQAVYTMPVMVSAETPNAAKLLEEKIKQDLDEANSLYEKQVTLPKQLDGKSISFSKPKEHKAYLFLLLAAAGILVILFGYDRKLDQRIRQRNEQMLLDFSEIVSKLSLLYEAGSSIYTAWVKIVEDYEKKEHHEDHFAYQEMKMVLEKIKSGMSEKEAYAQFGKRCGLHPYIKLGNLLEQNLSKGTKGMKLLLKQEVNDSFEERKRIARKRGEEAGTKLLLPMILMLIVVIIIIAVPALMTIQL